MSAAAAKARGVASRAVRGLRDAAPLPRGDAAVRHVFWPMACVCACVLLASPIHLIAAQPDEFSIPSLGRFWLNLSATALVVGVALLAAAVVTARRSARVGAVLAAACLPVLLWSGYLPLSVGVLDGRGLGVAPMALALGGLLALLGLSRAPWAPRLAAILAVGPVLTAAAAGTGLRAAPPGEGTLPLSARGGDVIVLGFDSLEAGHVSAVLARRPDLAARLSGFTAWPNAAAPAPATIHATSAILLGRLPDSDREDRRAPTIADAFADAGYTVGLGTFYHYALREGMADLATGARRTNAFTAARNASTGAMLRVAPIAEGAAAKLVRTAHGAVLRVDDDPIWRIIKADPSQHVGPKLTDLRVFAEMTREPTVADGPPTFRMLHFLFTHAPARLDADCGYRRTRNGSPERAALALAETECALGRLADYLDRLRALGTYERSAIVVLSDHGRFCDDRPSDAAAFDVRGFCAARWTPLLLTKPAGADGPLATRPEHVALTDVASTLCPLLGSAAQGACDAFPGADLFADGPLDAARPRAVLVPRRGPGGAGAGGQTRDAFERVEVGRDAPVLVALERLADA